MAMTPRTEFLIQLLQKLGAPLMEAVNTHATDDGKDAGIMASMMSESVKIGISLSQAMNLRAEDGDADAIRVALASLAGELVADSYKQTGRVPSDQDGRRIAKTLESVIVFADNFAPAAEHAKRLSSLEGVPPFFDPAQTSIYAIHALLPVIGAVSEFSFGQSETRLVQEIADRLKTQAKEMQAGLGTNANGMDELVILQALARLYASAHRGETGKLRGAGDADGSASIEAVWRAYDRQRAMLEVILSSMAGVSLPSSSSGGSSAVKPDQAPAAPPPAAPAATAPATPAAQSAGGSPMSFFKKT